MANGQKCINKKYNKPKQVKKGPASTPELFSKSFAPNVREPKKNWRRGGDFDQGRCTHPASGSAPAAHGGGKADLREASQGET